ncbi:MAG: spore coat protein CotJB [Eubacterium sp.]|nr:spore coat protein CotJB [Eubacterium sp.]
MVGNTTPQCARLMQQLAAADFFALDMQLYLDTHPDDTKALEIYREAVKQAKACRQAFEASCYPLRATSAGEGCTWNWLNGLWP